MVVVWCWVTILRCTIYIFSQAIHTNLVGKQNWYLWLLPLLEKKQ